MQSIEQRERFDHFLNDLENGKFRQTSSFLGYSDREGGVCLVGAMFQFEGIEVDSTEYWDIMNCDEGDSFVSDTFGIRRAFAWLEMRGDWVQDLREAIGQTTCQNYLDKEPIIAIDMLNDYAQWDFPTQARCLRENMDLLVVNE